ncbi:PspC domain-containing protein [Arsenophonus sp.]|uniref:PspC domain-containing protein n=1 Tax=Arsenophonus sp. TaxID=1872640 RepID=UPI0038D358AB
MAKMGARKLYRRTDQRMIGGVCAGLAHYFDLPVNLVRGTGGCGIILGIFCHYHRYLSVNVVFYRTGTGRLSG